MNTKHQDSHLELQADDEINCYLCGEELQSAWNFLRHVEEHQERKERLFECKLYSFTCIYDSEICDHMIKHVENVLTPKLSHMQGMYNVEIE